MIQKIPTEGWIQGGFQEQNLIKRKVAMVLLTNRREPNCMLFIYKSLVQKLPSYLCSLVTFKHSTYNVRSQDILTLAVPLIHTELFCTQVSLEKEILILMRLPV